jgi:hypothetical protein
VDGRSLAQDRYVDVNKPRRRIQVAEGRPAVVDSDRHAEATWLERGSWYALA